MNSPETKITGLHPRVVDALSATINEARARGLRVAMQNSLRTPDEQNALYAKGRTAPGSIVTNAKAWESWHCYGLAVDIVFKDERGEWLWDEKLAWQDLGTIGKMFGFQWGGDWTKFPDLPHFQITGKIPNINEAQRLLKEYGIEAVWNLC